MLLGTNDSLAILLIIPIAALAIGTVAWHFRRSQTLLERWAERNGFRLISHEYRWIRRGPFWWRTGEGQSVYRIEVIDADGMHRSGYVRVGGWFLGLFSDVASVEWD
ncbi:MAG TPA: hypothetical protein VNL70_05195 [Tepidisphaeraceae bacterium]|nr:hypothetical protein [Tepidisphaeraceae bacterium]